QPHRMRASMGLCEDANLFFYFFYHLGLFPVGSGDVPKLGPTAQDAIAYVRDHGRRFQMDFDATTNTPRFGDYGKLFLFYPDVWVRHDPAHPSTRGFNELLFITALVAIVWAFWFEGRAALGVWIVILVGSNPFQIFETYTRANVFSIPISTTLLALAVHLGYLSGRRTVDRWAWPIAVASGVVLATLRDVRTEAAVIAVSLLATYLWIRRASWVRRGLLVLAFVAAFLGTARAWDGFWRHKFVEAEQMVARAGGQVFRGAREMHHVLWHAVYCGLGDYGQDR